jgi:hypothetical protein
MSASSLAAKTAASRASKRGFIAAFASLGLCAWRTQRRDASATLAPRSKVAAGFPQQALSRDFHARLGFGLGVPVAVAIGGHPIERVIFRFPPEQRGDEIAAQLYDGGMRGHAAFNFAKFIACFIDPALLQKPLRCEHNLAITIVEGTLRLQLNLNLHWPESSERAICS